VSDTVLQNLIKTPEAIQIFVALNNDARFVGGCVRDSLLDKKITDIDIATPHLPDETIALLKAKGIKVVPTGLKHGTVTAVINGKNFEITTLRRDVACDGRHAEVEFTDDWQADAARRDFTINAMSADIEGNIYDYFSGTSDLERGVVRFVGDAMERCEEDILRILRFFRFNAYYSRGEMNDEGLVACIKFAPKIKDLSGERIQAEMCKLLAAPDPAYVLEVMNEIAVLKHLLPTNVNLTAMTGMVTLEKALSLSINPMRRLATLIKRGISDVTDLDSVVKTWKLSNKYLKYLESVILPPFEFSPTLTLSEQNKFIRKVGREFFIEILLINWAEDLALIDKKTNALYNSAYLHAQKIQIPVFPVDGNELKKIGIKEGRVMGNALRQAEEWWEASGYKVSKDEILNYIKMTNLLL
jgi:poly(A) polymerase